MVLDDEVLREVDGLIKHYQYFQGMEMKPQGLAEQRGFDLHRIELICAAEDYAPRPYLDYYEAGINNGNTNNRESKTRNWNITPGSS